MTQIPSVGLQLSLDPPIGPSHWRPAERSRARHPVGGVIRRVGVAASSGPGTPSRCLSFRSSEHSRAGMVVVRRGTSEAATSTARARANQHVARGANRPYGNPVLGNPGPCIGWNMRSSAVNASFTAAPGHTDLSHPRHTNTKTRAHCVNPRRTIARLRLHQRLVAPAPLPPVCTVPERIRRSHAGTDPHAW